MHISALYRYPVKSMGGQALDSAAVTPVGIEGDRRWMMVDDAGRFMTRRELPAMAQLTATPTDGGISLRHAAGTMINIPRPSTGAQVRTVRVWRDEVRALAAGEGADTFLSAMFGRPLHLVYQADDALRRVDPDYGMATDHVSFADGFPLLITTEESLADLNSHLPDAISMQRFRPNIVLSGVPYAWAEDHWRSLRIGPLRLRIVKPCSRCIITTQDPATGETVTRNEPLRTLRAIGRMGKGGIYFGQNAIADDSATVAVGDTVNIEETGPSTIAV